MSLKIKKYLIIKTISDFVYTREDLLYVKKIKNCTFLKPKFKTSGLKYFKKRLQGNGITGEWSNATVATDAKNRRSR